MATWCGRLALAASHSAPSSQQPMGPPLPLPPGAAARLGALKPRVEAGR